MSIQTDASIDVHLSPDDLRDSLCHDVVVGLEASPKWLSPKWFYDDRGSELFDEITRLAEYYPTEAERTILATSAAEIAAAADVDVLVELGSGTSDKTRILLDALCPRGLHTFVPFDVSEGILRYAAAVLNERHPELAVQGVVGDFEQHLGELPRPGRRMVALLGSTIGNFDPQQRTRFLRSIAATLEPGECLLLGTDLIKDERRLVAAYDDSLGVTAEFNRNVLQVLNRELGADFEPESFAHHARWNKAEHRIEMWLHAVGPQKVWIEAIDLGVSFEDGEGIRTELSTKFDRSLVDAELSAAGFTAAGWWTDPPGDFAVSLWRR
jgi:L-histidine N-alpha-methyltransferase